MAAGEFLPLPEFDAQALLHAWEEAVYALYLREGKIEEEVLETMRGWEHSGFAWTSRCIWRPATRGLAIEFAHFIFQGGQEPGLNGVPQVARFLQSALGRSRVLQASLFPCNNCNYKTLHLFGEKRYLRD